MGALCTSLQTVRNEDDSFDTYLAGIMINGEEKIVPWLTINFMMACEVPRLDGLMNCLHERPSRTFANLDLIQLGKFSFIGVEEVRLFNIQKVGKRPGRSRRMPKGKRKMRNMARPSIPSSEGLTKPTRQTRKRIVKEIED